MRKIIFRGKRKDNGEWVEGSAINTQYDIRGDKHTYIGIFVTSERYSLMKTIEWYEVYPETVGQYTGLTDKNGTKIFEGDIVRLPYPEHIETFVCFWDDGNIEFGLKNEKEDFGLAYASRDIEIIGNIHDNPELLKGGVE